MVLNAMCGTTKLGKSLAIIYNYLHIWQKVSEEGRTFMCIPYENTLLCVHTLFKKNKVHPPFPKVSNLTARAHIIVPQKFISNQLDILCTYVPCCKNTEKKSNLGHLRDLWILFKNCFKNPQLDVLKNSFRDQ